MTHDTAPADLRMSTERCARSVRAWPVLALIILGWAAAPAALAQPSATSSPVALLDRMTGHWLMTGTISKARVAHDVDVDWVLNRQYIRIHEVSREKDARGNAAYEAWIYLVWDATSGEYAVMWLDNTAATNFSADGVGHAKPDGDRIPIVFKDAAGSGIRTTFAYDRAHDTWSWAIDNVAVSGASSPFARLTLARK